jgi:hypothetical protein
MALQDETDVWKTNSLNGFLHRWRRNASHAGVLTAVLTFLVAAVAVFALCACKAIGGGR